MSLELSSNFPQFNIDMRNINVSSIYEFGDFRLDVDNLMLYRSGIEVSLPPKVVKTLAVLVEGRGEIVSKDELMEKVWEDAVVEESNLSQYLYLLRKTVGNKPDGNNYIETLRRRGYRFNGEIRETRCEKLNGTSARAEGPQVQAIREGNVLRLAEWQPATYSEPAVSQRPLPVTPVSAVPSVFPKLIVAGILVAATVIAVAYFGSRILSSTVPSENAREVTITRLTNGSWVDAGTISRDGKYFVYCEIHGKSSRLFLQQTGQNSRVEIVSSSDHQFSNPAFSPDGSWIYYSASANDSPEMILYRVPTIGGSPTKLLENVHAVSLSPNGKSMAFKRGSGLENSHIVVADKDGRAEKIILQRGGQKTIGYLTWSPNGRTIVFSELDRTDVWKWYLRELDIETGVEKSLGEETWGNLFRMEWVPDGSGIVVIGTRQGEGLSIHRDQVYFVTYPGGASTRVTNDGNRHHPTALGVTNDGEIFAVPATRSCQIWSMDAKGDASTATQITRGMGDGRGGLVPMPDERIAYTTRTAEDVTIWIANGDGSNQRQVATSFKYLEELRGDPSGKYFVFSAPLDLNAQSPQHLFSIDIDGGNTKQLTFGNSQQIDSTISPDGKTLVTDVDDMATAGEPRTTLQRFSAGGGAGEKISNLACLTPIFSPDGSKISCVRDQIDVFVINAFDGNMIQSFKIPYNNGSNIGAVWTPDGKGLVVITHENGVSNLTVFPLDKRKPYKLTNFSSGVIYRFAYSRDASRILLARGYPTQDAILIRNGYGNGTVR
jgi:Tol biopolymer transport system component/DNA-binding winged helix-turn-helix (wHTH) protein